ncbi:hypothetical protein CLOBOL_06242 [Enterocloster bolteae ATCC BAA-613]|uniref:Uncharacterized protein n=1 Tax=Enterocloster bolteae (strain ATCC BAA-613 / DSM 15670 / CCUG 46953 / JCM 12243 / WAL 16351) TaxID=411902 RepID=A8S215_ENTBW|nr:hypothetical protein CLOBOL_06242 [Enterocloster bolteae ATCC BAA-613]
MTFTIGGIIGILLGIYSIKNNTVMYIAGRYFTIRYKAVYITLLTRF